MLHQTLNVTQIGTIHLIHEQPYAHGAIEFIGKQLGARVKTIGYNYSDILLSRIYTAFCGGNATEDVNYVKNNILKHLHGISIPSADTDNWRACTINFQDMEVNSFKYRFGKYGHRIIAYRVPNETGQRSVFTNDAKKYLFIITNDWDISEKKAIVFYNKRGDSERFFDMQNINICN